MYKTILVPLDGSELAEAILPHVEELAKLFGSTVIFLQVLELPHLVGLPKGDIYDALPQMTPGEVSQHVQNTRRYLEGLVERLENEGIAAQSLIEYGPVVVTIMRAARQEDAGLIAMASHGRGGLTDVYYGSVAAGVLQRIDRPLLIVRAQK
jgi:nucleotide-binding universal stress UspA family protein